MSFPRLLANGQKQYNAYNPKSGEFEQPVNLVSPTITGGTFNNITINNSIYNSVTINGGSAVNLEIDNGIFTDPTISDAQLNGTTTITGTLRTADENVAVFFWDNFNLADTLAAYTTLPFNTSSKIFGNYPTPGGASLTTTSAGLYTIQLNARGVFASVLGSSTFAINVGATTVTNSYETVLSNGIAKVDTTNKILQITFTGFLQNGTTITIEGAQNSGGAVTFDVYCHVMFHSQLV